MTRTDRKAVKEFILKTSLGILKKKKDRSIAELRQAMPFHLLFFGDEGIVAAANQRSIVTSMGTVLYPGLAKTVAELNYKKVILGRKRLLNDLYAKRRKPDHSKEMKEILSARGGAKRSVEVLPDLYIGDFKPGPLFVELKSPIANLDVSAESKRKILTFLVLMDAQKIKRAEAYLGFTYNPYVERDNFKHWPVLQMMDMEKQVLIGEELWDKLGGPGTFTAIVSIIRDVRKDLTKTLDVPTHS